jgi:hypothetical protein
MSVKTEHRIFSIGREEQVDKVATYGANTGASEEFKSDIQAAAHLYYPYFT